MDLIIGFKDFCVIERNHWELMSSLMVDDKLSCYCKGRALIADNVNYFVSTSDDNSCESLCGYLDEYNNRIRSAIKGNIMPYDDGMLDEISFLKKITVGEYDR